VYLQRIWGQVIPGSILMDYSIRQILPKILVCIDGCMGETFQNYPWAVAGEERQEVLANLSMQHNAMLHTMDELPSEWNLSILIRLQGDYVRSSPWELQSYTLGEYRNASRCLNYCFIEQCTANYGKVLGSYSNTDDYFLIRKRICYGLNDVNILPHNNDSVIIFYFEPTLEMWGDWLKAVLT